MAILWFAPMAKCEIGSAIASFAIDETIAAQLVDEVDYSGMVKNVRISGGERDVDTQKLIGYNELLDKKRATIVEASFTCAYQGSIKFLNSDLVRQTNPDFAEMMMGEKQTVTGDYMRATGGEKPEYDRESKAVNFELTDGTYTVNCLLNNALMTSREMSLDAEGHIESTVAFKCLASNYYEEDNFV